MIDVSGKYEESDSRSAQENQILKLWTKFRDCQLSKGQCDIDIVDGEVFGRSIFYLSDNRELRSDEDHPYFHKVFEQVNLAYKLMCERFTGEDMFEVALYLERKSIHFSAIVGNVMVLYIPNPERPLMADVMFWTAEMYSMVHEFSTAPVALVTSDID